MEHKLQDIAYRAGRFILGAKQTKHTNKTNSKDFVTVADIKAQNIIEKQLKQEFPNIQVVSEEHGLEAHTKLKDPKFSGFVIDPIDGTYNFKRDMLESAISIGYIKNGQPKTGVIYDPYKDEMFCATKGKGASRNGWAIQVSDQSSLDGASVATSNSYNDAAMERNLKRHLAIYKNSGVMPWTSCPGSGVLIMAGIACGRYDIYHHNGLKPWDNAAAFLLIREAGGAVITLKGEEALFTSPTVLAGPKELVLVLRQIFARIDQRLLT